MTHSPETQGRQRRLLHAYEVAIGLSGDALEKFLESFSQGEREEIEELLKFSSRNRLSLSAAAFPRVSTSTARQPSHGLEEGHERLGEIARTGNFGAGARQVILGEYVLLEKIGAGGMGAVYKARHQQTGRLVAIKVLPPKSMDSPDAVERFHLEVRAAARLNHPNVIMTFDADEQDGVHYLVMEYVEGQDLSKLVRTRDPLPVEEAIELIIQAARGLQYAHEQGIVHRDIKPGNLLLESSGVVKVLDLGLARLLESSLEGVPLVKQLTSTGLVMGTIDYMSPEQAEDTHRADQRSDIYSLGCTLFTLLTGGPVYPGDSIPRKLIAHRNAAIPSLRDHRETIPPSLDAIFQRMIAKRAEDRFQSMAEVISALERCFDEPIGGPDTVSFIGTPGIAKPADPTVRLSRAEIGDARKSARTISVPLSVVIGLSVVAAAFIAVGSIAYVRSVMKSRDVTSATEDDHEDALGKEGPTGIRANDGDKNEQSRVTSHTSSIGEQQGGMILGYQPPNPG